MFLFAVACYFLAGGTLAFFACFPSGRDAARRAAAGIWRRASVYRRTIVTTGLRSRRRARTALCRHAAVLGSAGRQQSERLCAALALLVVPSAAAWMLAHDRTPGGFDDILQPVNMHIAALLHGEQLVAPAPLPPEAFATQEVTQVRPMLPGASRHWELLDTEFSRRLLTVFRIMRERHGYDMTIIEGYRSPERQNMLARMGSQVTNAAAFQSYHQVGLASDCAFIRNGKLVISERDPWAMRGYELFGETAESVGLHWGGRWRMQDFGHVEFRAPGSLKPPGRTLDAYPNSRTVDEPDTAVALRTTS